MNLLIILVVMFQSQIDNAPSVIKRYDGVNWSTIGLIRNDAKWDALLNELQKSKTIYSHGSCCYNEKFINGIKIEGSFTPWSYIIDDASPDGRNEQLQMYWREKFTVEDPFEPGFSKIASKKLSAKIRAFIADSVRMNKMTYSSMLSCRGQDDDFMPTYCKYGVEVADKKVTDSLDSTRYTRTVSLQVFVDPKYGANPHNKWVTIVDSLGIIAQVPHLAILRYDSIQMAKRTEKGFSKEKYYRNNIKLLLWAVKRFECSVIDKATGLPKRKISRTIVTERCGDMCDSFNRYLYLNSSFRIHEHGIQQ